MNAIRNKYARLLTGLAIGGWLTLGAIQSAHAQASEIQPDFFEDEYIVDEEPDFASPAPSPIALRKIDDPVWSKATDNLDYTETPEEKKEKKDAPQLPVLPKRNSYGEKIQIISIALAIVLIGLGIFAALRQPPDKRVKRPDALITPENIEQYLETANINPMLAQALNTSDYALAIRYQYLRCLQKLGIRQLVKLSAEKTNRQYLRELNNSGLKPEFAQLTLFYENVWYGRAPVDLQRYQELSMIYEVFLKKIS